MNGLIDGADRVYWWLRQRPPVAGGIAVAIVAVIAVLLLTGGSDSKGGGGGKLPATAVAKVGDTAITRTELTHWQAVYTASSTSTTKPTVAAARQAAFELLAGSAWITAEAARQNVTATAAETKTAADNYLKQAAAAAKVTQAQLLQQMGTTSADVSFQQRVSLLASKLQAKIIKALPAPTSAQIAAAYKAQPGRWATPSRRDVSALITTKANATVALAAIKSGATFAQANQQYSTNSTLTSTQGALTKLVPGTTDGDVEAPIFAAPVNQLLGPVKIGDAYLVFKVTKSTPLAKQTLAQATKKISADLATTAQTAATTSFLGDLRNRWRPKTICAPLVQTSQYCAPKKA